MAKPNLFDFFGKNKLRQVRMVVVHFCSAGFEFLDCNNHSIVTESGKIIIYDQFLATTCDVAEVEKYVRLMVDELGDCELEFVKDKYIRNVKAMWRIIPLDGIGVEARIIPKVYSGGAAKKILQEDIVQLAV